MLKNVIEIGTCSNIPTIPETRESIIIVNDVKVFILRIEIPEALPTVLLQQFPHIELQVASPQSGAQQLSPQLLQQSSQQLWQQLSQETQQLFAQFWQHSSTQLNFNHHFEIE